MNKVILDTLNKYKIGVGTAIAVVVGLMWGSYELGTSGWDTLNLKFVDHAEAAEFVTWQQFEVREKKKNIRLMESKIIDLRILKAENEGNKAVEKEINASLIRLEAGIKNEKTAVTCLQSEEEHVCDF